MLSERRPRIGCGLGSPQLRLKPICPYQPGRAFPGPLPFSLPCLARPLPLGTRAGAGGQPTGPGERPRRGRVPSEAQEMAWSWGLPGGGGWPGLPQPQVPLAPHGVNQSRLPLTHPSLPHQTPPILYKHSLNSTSSGKSSPTTHPQARRPCPSPSRSRPCPSWYLRCVSHPGAPACSRVPRWWRKSGRSCGRAPPCPPAGQRCQVGGSVPICRMRTPSPRQMPRAQSHMPPSH